MADRLQIVASNIGLGNASSISSAVYSLAPGPTTLALTKDDGGHATFDTHTIHSNTIVTTNVSTTRVDANLVTVANANITDTLYTQAIDVAGNVSIGGTDVFRIQSGNVVLGNDAYIQSGTNTWSATSLVGRSNVHTNLLSANTIVANGINVMDAIQNVMKSSIRYYVKTTGDDSNDGRSWDNAFQTVNKAASVAGQYSTIYIESGDYVIQNPIHLNRRVSVIGDNLRSTRIFPQNPKLHFFFVDDLCYIAGLRFMNHRRPAFCVSFACCIAEAEVQFERLSAINVLYTPTGYTNVPPVVVVEAPESSFGKAPTATASLNGSGQVNGITLVTAGDLYPGTTPVVTIGEPQLSTGIQPTVTASVSGGSVNGFVINSTGTPYITPPTVTIDPPSGGGVQATAIASLNANGYLDAVTLQDAGSGYVSAPTVNISVPPSIQATATIVMNFQGQYGVPLSFTITNPGSGYSTAPTVTIEPPESIQATAVANVVNGIVDRVDITNPGSGYTNLFARPHISIPPPTQKRAFITGSPYIQNSSSICGPVNRQGDLLTVLPPYDTVVYDVDITGAGGGCLVDGWVTHVNSPLRSMVCDSFTQVNQGGPGHLILNTGYAQFVSCFTTFCSYSYRSIGGGTTNISTSVTDFGTWGLVATGYWPNPIATGTINQAYRSEVASVVIPEGRGGSGYTSPPTVVFSSGTATATATLLADRVDSVLVTNPGAYEETPTVTFVGGGGSGASGTVNMTNPSPIRIYNTTGRKPDQGSVCRHRGVWQTVIGASFITNGVYDVTLYPGLFTADAGETLEFYVGSTVGTGQHVMEYAGSGTTYNALLEYGGQPNDGNQVYEVFPGRVFYCITDHIGNQSIGRFFAVEQLTGAVTLNTDRFSLSGLEAIGPFKRNGNPAGVRLEEVSNDVRLVDSTGVVGATTAPTQFSVKTYVDARALKPAGEQGAAYVKNSNNDYDASWIPVVLESEKAQPLGVANLDAQGRIVGDGSILSNIDASELSFGTISQSVLPTTLGNTSTTFVGDGVGLTSTNAANLSGTIPQRVLSTTLGNASTTFVGDGFGLTSTNAANLSGTLPQAVFPSTIDGTTFVGDGFGLTSLNAANLTGTVPQDVLSATLGNASTTFVGDGFGLTSTNAANLTGTLPQDVFPSTIPAGTSFVGDGFGLTSLNAANLTGTVPQDVLSTTLGNASTTFVGDGFGLTSTNAANLSGTLPQDVFPSTIAGTSFVGDGFGLTSTNAANLSGTLPQDVFPSTIAGTTFVGDGFGLTSTNAANLTGTLPQDVFPSTIGDGTTIFTGVFNGTVNGGQITQAMLPQTLGNTLTQFVGDGSLITSLNASFVSSGTLNNARLPGTIGTTSTSFVGSGLGLNSINGANVSTGLISVNRLGTGSPTGTGALVLSTSPTLTNKLTITGGTPTITLRDTNHNSGFIHCNSNLLYILRGGTNSTTWTQVGGQWPMIINLTNNDCTIGRNLNAVGDVAAYASDERLKMNVRPITSTPLDDLQQIRGVRFDWNPETPQPFSGTDVGLIAQDVQRVLPEAIKPAPFDHSPEDGSSISGHEYLTIDSGNKVTALLVECIKELHMKVRDLEARLAAE